MLTYIILLAVSVGAGIPLCGKKCGKWGKAVYCAVLAVAFTIISAIRYRVGYDFNSYGLMYNNLTYSGFEDVIANRVEKGFLLPLYYLNLGFENYWAVFIYTSVIIYFSLFAMIYTRSEVPWISVCGFLCFGIFFNSLCFLRQIIAAIIIAYAVRFIGDKIPFRFFIMVLAAATFHWSALLMAGLYIFLRIKPSVIYLGIVTAGTVIFCIFSRKAMSLLTDVFYMYKSYDPTTSVEASNGLPPRYTVMFGVLFIVCFLFRKKLIEKNPRNAIYINCLMFTTVFEAMGTRHAILSRLAILTYIPPIIFMLPDVVEVVSEYANEKKGSIAKWLSRSALAAYAAAFYFILMINNYNGVMPYRTQLDAPRKQTPPVVDTVNIDDDEDEDEYEDDEEYDIGDDEDYDEYEDTADDNEGYDDNEYEYEDIDDDEDYDDYEDEDDEDEDEDEEIEIVIDDLEF